MAKASTPAKEVNSVDLEARAWELFARNVNVVGTPTTTHEHLACECFKAAAAFEAAVGPTKEEPKG